MAIPALAKDVYTYIYLLICTPWLLSHFTLDILLQLLPWNRPTAEWSLNQAARMRLISLVLLYWSLARSGDRLTLGHGRERNRFEAIPPASPKLYRAILSHALIRPDKLGMTWTPSRPPPADLVGSSIVVALHFHGGGFVIGNGRDEDTGYLARTLIRHLGCTHVCTPQYRLASGKNGQFPAPFQDALTAYVNLIRDKRIPATQIILSGDSAGANIVLGLLRYIHEYGELDDIPLPAAVTLWSPWVDVGAALHQDMTLSPNYKTDYLNREFGRWGASAISGFGKVDLSSPYLSPLHHPFTPAASIPMYVNAGEREVLCDDIKGFCQRYREVGWQICLDVSKGCPHDIILLGSTVGFAAEAEEAAENAGRFLVENAGVNLRNLNRVRLVGLEGK
ncbi:hypothetical protein AK830_g6042 [Neonectria ditissima]|uniref:Alpha/beta hydrolase fold-3 domain-containing protein n=1 Tax=Neonectria ditissima TaxID=78410 RepID=A0A0N8H714_9HYPO|nr:hypothetical protein AK830_g6042 [Neonectria ditissima]